jgi:hypothetical protein
MDNDMHQARIEFAILPRALERTFSLLEISDCPAKV